MDFATPLIPATLIRRYKRFLADAVLDDGTAVTAHVANPGAMTGTAIPGSRIWLEPNDNPRTKLNFGWRLLERDGDFVCVDTSLANRIVAEGLRAGGVPGTAGHDTIRPEVKYADASRVDFLLTGGGPDLYIEVKSANFCRTPPLVEFPDSVTQRGARHMGDLARMVAQGHRAMVLYLITRTDCTTLTVARDIDPAYAAAFDDARAQGVEVLAMDCTISPHAVTLGQVRPLAL
ncbi:DNA/RNA nuclease SfsA [Loktanella sp. DJP18]|uniref:DNA/RNA nuclease SfsA n=1 Tax=Loktanella sp. DJP18 TaxID=3409788 RepID=UPI003BB6E052